MMKKKYFLLFILNFLLINVGISQITSNGNGEWSSEATWIGGVAPTATDDVLIAASDTIAVSDNLATCKSISFGGNDATIDMNPNARLTVYGDFTLFSTSHVAFSAGWSSTDAKIVFAGDAEQVLSGWSTTGGSTSFRDVEINKTGGFVTTGGNNMRLGIQNSLNIINGTFLLNDTDDIESRFASSGNYNTNIPSLNITVEANGRFDMGNTGHHHIRSGTGAAIGTLTVYGFARFTEDSSLGIYLTAIDVEEGGILQLSIGMADEYFHPGPITVKSGAELSLSSTADIWDDSLVEIQEGGVFSTTASTTIFPTNFIENGTVLYDRSTNDQTITDRDYNDLKIELANEGPKYWELAENRTIGSLSIDNGGQLVVLTSSGSVLSITGNVDIAAGTMLANNAGANGFVLKSTETKSSSLINAGTVVGDITYERFITANDWHLLGSPLTGQTIDANFITANTILGMQDYIENTDLWSTDYSTTAPDVAFTLAKGYKIKQGADAILKLSGAINSATVNIPLTRDLNGWNLLSNPFTSAIATNTEGSIHNLLSENVSVLDPSFNALYIWDQESARFEIINQLVDASALTLNQNFLQVGQGFFVKSSNPAMDNFTITPEMQSHKNEIPFKAEKDNVMTTITLNVESTNSNAKTSILFREEMSIGLDIGYDAGIFKSNADLELYTRLVEDNGVDFMLQCLPLDFSLTIPVGLDAKNGETIKFTASSTNLDAEHPVILEDRLLAVYTDLSSEGANYEINLAQDISGTGRFYLHTVEQSGVGINTLTNENPFQVFASVRDHQLVIRGDVVSNTMVRIYSVDGKLLNVLELKKLSENHLQFNEETGVYIIQIVNERATQTEKFSWVN